VIERSLEKSLFPD